MFGGFKACCERAEYAWDGLGLGFFEDVSRALGKSDAGGEDLAYRLERGFGLASLTLCILQRFLCCFVGFTCASFALDELLESKAVVFAQHLCAFEGIAFVLVERGQTVGLFLRLFQVI